MKRIAFVLLTACAIVFAGTSSAFATFGPHGGYSSDTDACAECHRAHTAISAVTWTDNQGAQKNALLISSSTSMTDFCYACHGDGAVGANTDVQSGYYDGDPTGTNSASGGTLNGGGFTHIGGLAGTGSTVMSSHNVDGLNTDALIRWGYVKNSASVKAPMAAFTCTDCHDPHGSSNYRLLKDVVNGVTVGGYVGTTSTPDPWVLSNEQGYPSGGWKKGAAGTAQVAIYKPSYTSAQYAQNSGRSMSAWCSACHTVYSQVAETGTGAAKSAPKWDYTNLIGGATASTTYHRHPIDVALSVGTKPAADRSLVTQLVDDPGLPLEMGITETRTGFSYVTGGKIWDDRGNVSCLTCHRAHGTASKMTGWAATALGSTGVPNTLSGTTDPAQDGFKAPNVSTGTTKGVDPTFDAALLRYDNRGVCERCHNK